MFLRISMFVCVTAATALWAAPGDDPVHARCAASLGRTPVFPAQEVPRLPSDHLPVTVLLEVAELDMVIERVPPPPDLTPVQAEVWILVSGPFSWATARSVLAQNPNVLSRAHRWHLATWHFDRWVRDLGQGRLNSPHRGYLADVLEDGELRLFLNHMEDLADQ